MIKFDQQLIFLDQRPGEKLGEMIKRLRVLYHAEQARRWKEDELSLKSARLEPEESDIELKRRYWRLCYYRQKQKKLREAINEKRSKKTKNS